MLEGGLYRCAGRINSGLGVTLILTIDSLSAFAEGNDFPRQRYWPFVRLSEQRPGAFKPLTLTQRAKRQNRLATLHPPAHPRALQALAHQGFTCGFDVSTIKRSSR